MQEYLRGFSELIAGERGWTWSVIGILYVIITLLIRSWFLKPITRLIKDLKRPHQSEVKSEYLKRALGGWLFYFASFLLVIFVWSRPQLRPLSVGQALELIVAVVCYILSLILHLQAIGAAGFITLKRTEVGRE